MERTDWGEKKDDPALFEPSKYHGLIFAGDELEPDETIEIPDDVCDIPAYYYGSNSALDNCEKITRSVICSNPHSWQKCVCDRNDSSWADKRTALSDSIINRRSDAYCMLLTGEAEVAICEVSKYAERTTEDDERPLNCKPTEDATFSVVDVGTLSLVRDEATVVTDLDRDDETVVDHFQTKSAAYYMSSIVKQTDSRLVGLNEEVICVERVVLHGPNVFAFVPYNLE